MIFDARWQNMATGTKQDLRTNLVTHCMIIGSPYGNRTHVAGMKILCPNH